MFQKKICVVVGGANGKGSCLVEEYAEQDYTIAFMDTDKESGNLLKEKMEQKYGKKVFFFHGDANSEEDLELFAGAIIGQYKKVDCLFYRTDISDEVKMIAELLSGYLKKDGIMEAYC